MGKALLVVIAVVLVIYSIFDVLATPRHQVKYLPRWGWVVLVLLVPYVGALGWLVFGTARLRPGRGGMPRPRPSGPRGPDDDPDYLRDL